MRLHLQGPGQHRYLLPFLLRRQSHRQITTELDTGIIAPHWLTLDEIRNLGTRLRSPLVLQCIEDYRNGRRFPLEVVVDGQT